MRRPLPPDWRVCSKNSRTRWWSPRPIYRTIRVIKMRCASISLPLQAVLSLDPLALEAWDEEAMSSRTPNLHTTMCGKGPVMVSMLLARAIGAEQVHVIHYANSGDVPEGEKDRVVGYAAIEFVKGQPPALSAEDKIALVEVSADDAGRISAGPHPTALHADLGCHGTTARHLRHAAPQTDARSARLPRRSLCALSVVGKCAARQRAQRHR